MHPATVYRKIYPMNYSALHPALSALIRQAGAAILEVYNRAEGFDVQHKADESPLTEADHRSNAVLCAGFAELTPDVPIISEENKQLPYADRRDYDHYWLIDPLDGTKDFIKRNGEFVINVALMRGKSPVAAWIYVPCREELYWAIKGEGAYWEKAGQVQRLQAARFSLRDKGLKVVCSRSHFNDATRVFTDQLDAPELISVGSALKFMLLARGEAQIYPRTGPTMEWDSAAPQLIVEEAGGKVVHFHQQEIPLVYNKENLLNPEFIAYGSIV